MRGAMLTLQPNVTEPPTRTALGVGSCTNETGLTCRA